MDEKDDIMSLIPKTECQCGFKSDLKAFLKMINEMNFQLLKSGEISWTGLRLLIIFAALLEKPLSEKEIQIYFEENYYPKILL